MNKLGTNTKILASGRLDDEIARYVTELGYRLEMIFPADSPREALVSKGEASIRLVVEDHHPIEMLTSPRHEAIWAKGRAGMEYRDLIPERVGGKVIASHIRLHENGPVADYVHYHKVEFQMIYCLNGRIQVVYEDQGPPFWMEAGDCVVQPPEIRHRVLYAEGEAEVLEVTMPAEHETWVDHKMTLPNPTIDKARLFNGQRFVFSKAPKA